MQAFSYTLYILLGIVQMLAVYTFFSDVWQWEIFLAAPVAFIVSYIPILGPIAGTYAAITVWGLQWWIACLIFLVPLTINVLAVFIRAAVALSGTSPR